MRTEYEANRALAQQPAPTRGAYSAAHAGRVRRAMQQAQRQRRLRARLCHAATVATCLSAFASIGVLLALGV